MGYMDVIKEFIGKIRNFLGIPPYSALQPKEILEKIFLELEKKKKLGIEENAYVPNVFAIYLSPADHEELSPFLSGIRDQLIKKIMEKVRKKGYKLLSASISLDIREDSGLEKNQMVIESSFLKEKEGTLPYSYPSEEKTVPPIKEEAKISPEPLQKTDLTRIAEEKRTQMIDNTKARLEILQGGGRGDIIPLKEGDYTFGRGRDAAILLSDPEDIISRVHFKLSVRDQKVRIKDLKSTNGTKVNGIDIEDAELKKGDTISAGKVILKVA